MFKNIFKKVIVSILQWEAKMVLRKYKPRIIAVTGSVGKTSTKDAIFSVLSKSFFIRKSEKSFNSDVGVPLAILGLQNAWYNPFIWIKNVYTGLKLILFPADYPKWLVLEVGADRPGDIEKLSSWLSPDIVVLTRIPEVPVHVEFFSSPEEVAKEKGYLVKALKENGLLILNGDDPQGVELKKLTRAPSFSYGFSEGNTVQASYADILYEGKTPKGMLFHLNFKGKSTPIRLTGVLGRQHIYPALAALTVGLSQGLSISKMARMFEKTAFPPGRMHLIEGLRGSVIIDDTYNSSPIALKEALVVLQSLSVQGRKIAVLGDMLELGKYSIEEHRNAGKMSADVSHLLVTVGMRARTIDAGAENKRMGKKKRVHFETSTEAGEYLKGIVGEGDTVLVKGSQSIRMEKVIERIMAHPEDKEKLLVRQEEEWLKR